MRTPLALARLVPFPAMGCNSKVTAAVLDSRENVPAAEVLEGETEGVVPKVNIRSAK